MVSRVAYPHVTKQVLRGRRSVGHLIQVLLVAFIVVLVREVALLVLFLGYSLGVPIWELAAKKLPRSGRGPGHAGGQA